MGFSGGEYSVQLVFRGFVESPTDFFIFVPIGSSPSLKNLIHWRAS